MLMKQLHAFYLLLFTAISVSGASESSPTPTRLMPVAPDRQVLTKLLQGFLAGASKNDAAMHDRFWSDDLIYTSSSGQRMGKADIMRHVREEGPAKPGQEETVFTAEDIQIHQYDNAAIVAFRLVGTTTKQGKTEVANYLNTGTFLKKEGEWRAVAWQATALPGNPKQ